MIGPEIQSMTATARNESWQPTSKRFEGFSRSVVNAANASAFPGLTGRFLPSAKQPASVMAADLATEGASPTKSE